MGNILGLKRGNAVRNINGLGYQLFKKSSENSQLFNC